MKAKKKEQKGTHTHKKRLGLQYLYLATKVILSSNSTHRTALLTFHFDLMVHVISS